MDTNKTKIKNYAYYISYVSTNARGMTRYGAEIKHLTELIKNGEQLTILSQNLHELNNNDNFCILKDFIILSFIRLPDNDIEVEV